MSFFAWRRVRVSSSGPAGGAFKGVLPEAARSAP
jgi:hypothetical protein